jgi:hypothetical protein
MGLTIHYNLSTDLKKPKDIRQLVETIRQFALDLPFKNVGELKEFADEDPHDSADDVERWLRSQAEGHVESNGNYYSVPARRTFAFSTWPGDGSEAANFGFSLFPAFINRGNEKRLATKLRGWQWGSFCKTQYASNPRYGGVPNFIRSHLLVVKVLDFISQTGLAQVEVSDEGGFWEQRDLKALVQEVGDWNELLAGFTKELRQKAATNGQALEAAMTQFPNVEQLAEKGMERLANLRSR